MCKISIMLNICHVIRVSSKVILRKEDGKGWLLFHGITKSSSVLIGVVFIVFSREQPNIARFIVPMLPPVDLKVNYNINTLQQLWL